MAFRDPASSEELLSVDVRDALAQVAKGAPLRIVTCAPGRELHVVAHAGLSTLAGPLFLTTILAGIMALALLNSSIAGVIAMSVFVLGFAKWAHYRWLCARRQGFHFVRGEGLTRVVPGLGLMSRRKHVTYDRLLGKVDGRAFHAKVWLRYRSTRRGTDSEGRAIMVEDRSTIEEAHVKCTVLIDGDWDWALEVIAASHAEATRTVAALTTIFAAFAPTLAADGKEAAISKIEATTTEGSFARHEAMGTALLVREEWGGAEAELVRATELDPSQASAWNKLGRARLNQTPPQLEAALTCFERSIGLDPKPSYVHLNLAFALRKGGRDEEAMRALDRAIECAEAAKDEKAIKSLRATRAKWAPVV